MFAAILAVDGRLAETGAFTSPPIPAHRIEIVGEKRSVALIVSTEAAPFDCEWRGVERLGEPLWIVGRIRLDARDELRARLGDATAGDSDGLLCLRAYAKWGGRFLDFLAGDFCFALWDGASGTMLATRDQLGVRTLFHATIGPWRVVSDSLGWIATRRGFSSMLDDAWIADQLVFGRTLDFHRTVWRDVARLPPAHLLRHSDTNTDIRRYWRLTVDEPLHLRDRRHYGERFRELVARAVADRMPKGRVGVAMSGGLDSTTLAAFAVETTGDPRRVVAQCSHFEWLIPDEEAHFSSLVARRLGIELQLTAIDNLTFDADWRSKPNPFAEPTVAIMSAEIGRRFAQYLARLSPVWLYGEGPDNALVFERGAHFSWLARQRRWGRMAEAAWLYLGTMQARDWRATLRRYLRPLPPAGEAAPLLPQWIDPGLVHRLHLEERARDNEIVDRSHGWHPRAMGSFTNPIWQEIFRDRAQDEAWAPLVWRHPYFDLRVLQFLLSVPPVPWARAKLLIREAMRGRLPDEVLTRPKTPLADGPEVLPVLGALSSPGLLSAYVDTARLPATLPPGSDAGPLMAVHALDHWLTYNAGRTGVT